MTKIQPGRIWLPILFLVSIGCGWFQVSGSTPGSNGTPNSSMENNLPTFISNPTAETGLPSTLAPDQVANTTQLDTPTATVGNIFMSVDNRAAAGTCPPGHNFTIKAQFKTSQPGNVTFRWETSNTKAGSPQTITIDKSLTQTVSTTLVARTTGLYWVRVHAQTPGYQDFSQIFFTLTCQTPTPAPTPTPTRTPAPTQPPT